MNPVHIMLDSETTGKVAGCPILSLGACVVDTDHTPKLPSPFYERIRLESCFAIGLVSERETIDWWETQDAATKYEAFSGTRDIKTVLFEFISWLSQFDEPVLWANGSDFDFPILAHVYTKLGIPVPWKYNSIRDYRTLRKVFHYVKEPSENRMKHNALADAEYQAAHLASILNWIERCKNG